MLRVLLYTFLPLFLFASPEWFYNIKVKSSSVIIGYGSDKSLAVAKQHAMEDISKTISVNVQSDFSMNKSSGAEGYSKSIDQSINTSTQVNLTGVEFIKSKKIDELWYVAAKYDNSPLETKIKNSVAKDTDDEIQNTYLAKTPLIKKINEEVSKNLDYDIIRKDKMWNIKYNNHIFPLNQDQFYDLFTNVKTKQLELKPNQKSYNRYDKMYFDIKNQGIGYMSLLYVEHNGKVGVLFSNEKVSGSFRYPSQDDEDSFEIANPYHQNIYELYVAIYSQTELDLSIFENVANEYLDETSYNFDTLVDILDGERFSTYRIKIKK
jgi:hypothetical protein